MAAASSTMTRVHARLRKEIVRRPMPAAPDHGRRLVLPRHRYRESDRLGADLVGIGRCMLALAAAGEAGIVRMLELLEDEVIAVSGCSASPACRTRQSTCMRRPRRLRAFSAPSTAGIEPYRYEKAAAPVLFAL